MASGAMEYHQARRVESTENAARYGDMLEQLVDGAGKIFRIRHEAVFSGTVRDPDLTFDGYSPDPSQSFTSELIDPAGYPSGELFKYEVHRNPDNPNGFVAVRYDTYGETRWIALIDTNDEKVYTGMGMTKQLEEVEA
jgi:hypothetical protein